jgi:hypothetical protein
LAKKVGVGCPPSSNSISLPRNLVQRGGSPVPPSLHLPRLDTDLRAPETLVQCPERSSLGERVIFHQKWSPSRTINSRPDPETISLLSAIDAMRPCWSPSARSPGHDRIVHIDGETCSEQRSPNLLQERPSGMAKPKLCVRYPHSTLTESRRLRAWINSNPTLYSSIAGEYSSSSGPRAIFLIGGSADA